MLIYLSHSEFYLSTIFDEPISVVAAQARSVYDSGTKVIHLLLSALQLVFLRSINENATW